MRAKPLPRAPTANRLIADKFSYILNALKSAKSRVSPTLRGGKIFRRLISALSLFSISFTVFSSLYFYLPAYINSYGVPRLAEKLGIPGLSCEVRRIGFSGLDIGSLQIASALSVQSVQSDYSLAELYQRHIRRISFSGTEIYFRFKEGKLSLRGGDFSRGKKFFAPTSSPQTEIHAPILPFSVGKFEIRNAVLICERENEKPFRLPLELEILPDLSDPARFVCTLKVYPRGEEIIFTARPDLNRKKMKLNIAADGFSPERFSDFLKTLPGIRLTGPSDIKAEADISFDLSSEPGKFNFSLSSLSVFSPIPFRISDIQSTAKLTAKGIESSGTFNLSSPPSSLTPKPFQTRGNFFADIEEKGNWEFGVTVLDPSVSKQKQRVEIRLNSANLTSDIPEFQIRAKGCKQRGTANYTLIAPNITLASNAASIKIPSLSLKGKTDIGDTFRSEAILEIPDADITASKLKIQGIRAYLPLTLPSGASGKKGSLSAKVLQWDNLNLGSVSTSVHQEEANLLLEGKFLGRLLPGLVLGISGKVGKNDTRLCFELPEYKPVSDIDLGRFSAKAKGLTVNGRLKLKAELNFGNDSLKSRLDSELSHATIRFKDKDTAVEDLSLGFSMPDIFAGYSAAKQKFSFKKASFGKIILHEGKAEFQLDPDGSLLIERSSFKWCKGNVLLSALRISPGVEVYEPVLYCDRLNLAELIGQFGLASAEGEGSVNGRIPLQFRQGKIKFGEAFLFSTPGDGGTIHVSGAETLTAGIPRNTPQYAQIDLAKEALKNFDYKWARLRLNTEGQDLRLQLQFDGSPSDPLPFVYKKELGSFVRVGAESNGSKFQGIRLDVNMLLPLDKILQYKSMF